MCNKKEFDDMKFQSSHILDLKTSILYVNGSATMVQLDYEMDVTTFNQVKKRRRKSGKNKDQNSILCNGVDHCRNDENYQLE